MNKSKQTEHKKLLVRNTSRPVSKVSILNSKSRCSDEKSKSAKSDKKSLPSECATDPKTVETFESPELNSALRLARKIETLECVKPRKTKSVSTVDSNKLSLDDKVTKLVNFPYDKHIYRDLIPIDIKESVSPPVSSRPPLPHKDKEPVLSDYFQPTRSKEYYYQPKNKPDKDHSIPYKHNNLRLYKVLQLAYDKS